MKAGHSAVPEQPEAFWKSFRSELDAKLNQRLVPPSKGVVAGLRRWPVVAVATLCLVIFAFSAKVRMAAPPVRLVAEETELIEELNTLEDLEPGFLQDTAPDTLNGLEDA